MVYIQISYIPIENEMLGITYFLFRMNKNTLRLKEESFIINIISV